MPKIFISYRRGDTRPYAAWLHEHLAGRFGRRNVFIDVLTITPGQEFPSAIETRIKSANVVIALIGTTWLDARTDAGELRLADPADYVRGEIAAALERRIRVIPVLVEGAAMPPRERLPSDLQALTSHQAVQIASGNFAEDSKKLITAIEGWRRYVRWSLAGLLIIAAVLLATSLTINTPLALQRLVTGQQLVVIMDSGLLVYGSAQQDAGKTNYDDIYDILHDMSGFKLDLRREPTFPTWRREHVVQQLDPDLIIVHASCFYSETTPSDFEGRLISFLREMKGTRARFLVYSRDSGIQPSLARLEAEDPRLRGRIVFFEVPGRSRAMFRDPTTARELKQYVMGLLKRRSLTVLFWIFIVGKPQEDVARPWTPSGFLSRATWRRAPTAEAGLGQSATAHRR